MNIAMSTQGVRFWRITGAESLTLPVDGSVQEWPASAAVRQDHLKRSSSSIAETAQAMAPPRLLLDPMDSRARCDTV